MNLTTEQMQAILDGAPDGASHYIMMSTPKRPWYFIFRDGIPHCYSYRVESFLAYPSCQTAIEDFIKLSDIRAELSSRQSVQAYFASDERGSIEQEQSVIERVKELRRRVDHLDDVAWSEYQRTANDLHQGGHAAFSQVLNLIDELFSEVAGDE